MIDQERVATMTKLAIMGKREGDNLVKLNSYRKYDYMLTQIFRGFVAGTVCYLLGLILWFCYLWDSLNDFVVNLDLLGLLTDIAVGYLIFMAIYLVICGFIGLRMHSRCRELRYQYTSYLRILKKSYDTERRAKAMGKTGKSNRGDNGRKREET